MPRLDVARLLCPAERIVDRQVGRERTDRRQVPARSIRRGTAMTGALGTTAREFLGLRGAGIGGLGACVRLPRLLFSDDIHRVLESIANLGLGAALVVLLAAARLSHGPLHAPARVDARPEHSAHQRRRPRRVARCRRGGRHRRCAFDRRLDLDARRIPGAVPVELKRVANGPRTCRATATSSCTATVPTRPRPRALRGCSSITDSSALHPLAASRGVGARRPWERPARLVEGRHPGRWHRRAFGSTSWAVMLPRQRGAQRPFGANAKKSGLGSLRGRRMKRTQAAVFDGGRRSSNDDREAVQHTHKSAGSGIGARLLTDGTGRAGVQLDHVGCEVGAGAALDREIGEHRIGNRKVSGSE